MILFDLANETGFLDIVGLDASPRAFFLSDELDGQWECFCRHHGIPSITLHSAYGELDQRCIVKCVADAGTVRTILASCPVDVSTDREFTVVEDGIWVSESLEMSKAYAVARAIVATLDFKRPEVEWTTSGPLN